MPSDTNKKSIYLRVDAKLHAKLKREADSNRRTIQAQAELFIEQGLDEAAQVVESAPSAR